LKLAGNGVEIPRCEAEDIAMKDNRKELRRRCFLGGRISFHHSWPETNCVIRNKSRLGARLVLADDRPLPSHFDLAVPDRLERHRASVAWRSGLEVGVLLAPAAANSN
jgi:hypothetical protein